MQMTSRRDLYKQSTLSRLRFWVGTAAFIVFASGVAIAQSTFGTVLGTARDSSGAVVAKCVVTVENTGTSAHRATLTDGSGDYSVPNLEPGVYKITMEAPGFQPFVHQIELTARETARIDGQMTVAGQAQSVNVETDANVINTEVSNIAVTKT